MHWNCLLKRLLIFSKWNSTLRLHCYFFLIHHPTIVIVSFISQVKNLKKTNSQTTCMQNEFIYKCNNISYKIAIPKSCVHGTTLFTTFSFYYIIVKMLFLLQQRLFWKGRHTKNRRTLCLGDDVALALYASLNNRYLVFWLYTNTI